MISTIAEFEKTWTEELEKTQKIFERLTDQSLSQAVGSKDRTLARIAWHIVTTLAEMMSTVGLTPPGPKPDDLVPPSVQAIAAAYVVNARSLLDQVKSSRTDETLEVEDDLYGETWKRGYTLTGLIHHEIHHRGQITVLMRQAGLQVPGIYGPAREEWALFGTKEPEV